MPEFRAGIPNADRGTADGVATLDGDGQLNADQAALLMPVAFWPRPRAAYGLPMWPGLTTVAGDGPLNTMLTWFIPVPHPVTIDQIGIDVTTAEASATPRLGLYEVGSDGLAGNLLVDAGTVDASTTGAKVITLGSEVSVTTGAVMGAVAFQGVSSTLRIRAYERGSGMNYPTFASAATSDLFSANPKSCWANGSVSGALPDSRGGGSLSNTRVPLMWLRVGSVL